MTMLLRLAALSGAMAVAAGAYGTHGATGLTAELLRTGGLYQMVHAVAVVALALSGRFRIAATAMLAGSAAFALSLYALAFGAPHLLGIVTPLGGVGMIAGWLLIALGR